MKGLKKYIKELKQIRQKSTEDVRLVGQVVARLEEINKPKELYHYTLTLKKQRDFSYTSSDYRFLDRVITRLQKILEKAS
jgi:hypothetical protein